VPLKALSWTSLSQIQAQFDFSRTADGVLREFIAGLNSLSVRLGSTNLHKNDQNFRVCEIWNFQEKLLAHSLANIDVDRN